MKRLFLLLISTLFVSFLSAQRFIYDVDLMSYFDNRESQIPYYNAQTLFGFRLSPEVGVEFDDAYGAKHRVVAGVSYSQPFGTMWGQYKIEPTVYYRYKQSGFQAAMGAIPYNTLLTNFSTLVLSDSLRYRCNNIYGAQFAYSSKHGYAELLLDWRSMPTKTTREAFRIVFSGRYQYHALFLGGYMHLNHLANKASSQPKEGVCDDFLMNVFVGVDFTEITPLDSLSIKASYVGGLQRNRATAEEYIPHGMLIDFYLRWKWIGFSNTFYYGSNQMPLYSVLGSQLNQGESLYSSKMYNKSSLFFTIVRRSFVNLTVHFDLHKVGGYKLSNQQKLVLNFNLDALVNKRQEPMQNFFL